MDGGWMVVSRRVCGRGSALLSSPYFLTFNTATATATATAGKKHVCAAGR